MQWHRAYNWRVLDTHDLPDDVVDLKRLVRQHRLEIEHLKLQLSRLRRWKFGRSREQLELEVTPPLQMSLEALQELTPPPAVVSDTPPVTTATTRAGSWSPGDEPGLWDRVNASVGPQYIWCDILTYQSDENGKGDGPRVGFWRRAPGRLR